MNLLNDIYYDKEYISLYLKEDEQLFEFEYINSNKIFKQITIKRPITNIGNIKVDDGFFDLETAYGYGGIYLNTNDTIFINKALTKYQEKCKDEKIIAEFMRFHPFNTFPINNKVFDINIYDRDVVVINLEQDILKSYSSKVRNIVKHSIENTTFQQSNDIDKFIELYTNTMDKNNADDFYFFDKQYFTNLICIKDVKLYEITFKDETIAMGFFIFSEDFIHYHLSANTALSYKLNANYALLHNIFLEAQKSNKRYCILGGGLTSSQSDSLFKFKKKFSKELKPFYISGKVYDEKVYNQYNKIWQEQSSQEVKYFLKYRLPIKKD